MDSSKSVDSKTTFVMLAWLMVTGFGTLQVQPVLGGALVDRTGITLSQMGILFGIELIAMAVGCGAAALAMNRVDRRFFCFVMLLLLAVANIGSGLSAGYVALCLTRGIAGTAGGAVQAVIFATAAARTNKDQTFAAINISLLAWGALAIAIVPATLQKLGIAAVYYSFALMALLALLGLGRIPRHAPEVSSARGTTKFSMQSGQVYALLALVGLVLTGHGGLWVYQERIGHALGMSQQSIGVILGASLLSGAVGAGLAGAINTRIGHMTAQLIALGGSIIASLVIVYGQSAVAFTVATLILMIVWFFGVTYLYGLAAEMDSSGRLVGVCNASVFVGQGLGPFVAGLVIGDGNFRAEGWLASGIYMVCIVLALYVTSMNTAREHSVATVVE